jgi:fermentation-respiration switch protein FrsA (DUF1100 family)
MVLLAFREPAQAIYNVIHQLGHDESIRLAIMIAPPPLLMILARNDVIVPAESIRDAFARAGEPKRLLEIEGGHYSVYRGKGADEAAKAATEWFTEHLVNAKTPSPAAAG